MLLTTVQSATLLGAVLLPAYVQGAIDASNSSAIFTLTECALLCIEAAGYSIGSEEAQRYLCLASRDSLLSTVEQCMLSTCVDDLAAVDEDFLTPIQIGCDALEVPVSDEDIEGAVAGAVEILGIDITSALSSLLVLPGSLPSLTTDVSSLTIATLIQSASISADIAVQAVSYSAQATSQPRNGVQDTPTTEVVIMQTASSTYLTTEVAVSTNIASSTTVVNAQPTSTAASLQPTSVVSSIAEIPTASTVQSVQITQQISHITTSQLASEHVSAQATSSVFSVATPQVSLPTSSAGGATIETSTSIMTISRTGTATGPTTTKTSFSTTTLARQTSQSTSSATTLTPTTTSKPRSSSSTPKSSSAKPTSSSTTASSTADEVLALDTASSSDDDNLVLETATPTPYTDTVSFMTSTTSAEAAVATHKTVTSTTGDGIGGGSPFSVSAAADSRQQIVTFAALSAALAICALIM